MKYFAVSGVFTDHMVIQRGMPICIYGTAPDFCTVTAAMCGKVSKAQTISGEWEVTLPSVPAGGPYCMDISCSNGEKISIHDILCGEVWLACGQSNMELPLCDSEITEEIKVCPDLENVRIYTVPRRAYESTDNKHPQLVSYIKPDTHWKKCAGIDAMQFSAVGYYFAKKLNETIDVPIGIIGCYWGGTGIISWMSEKYLRIIPKFSKQIDEYATIEKNIVMVDYDCEFIQYLQAVEDYEQQTAELGHPPLNTFYPSPPYGPKSYFRPSCLYRCMLSKVDRLRSRGILWYQGESDAIFDNYDIYRQALTNFFNMLKERSGNHNMLFLNVQLAPFGGDWLPGERWPKICQAQLEMTAYDEKYAMITIGDCGDVDIHPPKKREVGERLVLAFLNKYINGCIEYCGPLPDYAHTEGQTVVIHFTHANGGLVVKGSDVGRFEIAGDDGEYYIADSKVSDSHIEVNSKYVKIPISIRYEWDVFPKIGLFNRSGFPASLFSIQVENDEHYLVKTNISPLSDS